MYAVYEQAPGEWRLCVLEPGIADGDLLIRDLGYPQHELIAAEQLISLVSYDYEDATRVYP